MADLERLIFTDTEFQGYVDELNNLVGMLETQLGQAKEKKDELGKIWDDNQGHEYRNQINAVINGCENAIVDTQLQIASYQATIEGVKNLRTVADTAVTTASSAISELEL